VAGGRVFHIRARTLAAPAAPAAACVLSFKNKGLVAKIGLLHLRFTLLHLGFLVGRYM
jgi:hypothetical protein